MKLLVTVFVILVVMPLALLALVAYWAAKADMR
jgi:hypothetical protein